MELLSCQSQQWENNGTHWPEMSWTFMLVIPEVHLQVCSIPTYFAVTAYFLRLHHPSLIFKVLILVYIHATYIMWLRCIVWRVFICIYMYLYIFIYSYCIYIYLLYIWIECIYFYITLALNFSFFGEAFHVSGLWASDIECLLRPYHAPVERENRWRGFKSIYLVGKKHLGPQCFFGIDVLPFLCACYIAKDYHCCCKMHFMSFLCTIYRHWFRILVMSWFYGKGVKKSPLLQFEVL